MRSKFQDGWKTRLVLAAAFAVLGGDSWAVPFTAGNLAVYRVGVAADASNVTALGEPVFIDEYSPTGTLVQSVAVPTTTSGLQRRLVAHGSATGEGFINRSADGKYLVFAGYDAALGTANLNSSTASTVNRVVGRLDVNAALDTSTALVWASGNSPRSIVATNDGTRFLLVSGGTGVREANLGDVGTPIVYSSTTPAGRHFDSFGGGLFVTTGSTAAGVNSGIAEVNQTDGTPIYFSGVPTAATIDPWQFFLADLSPTEAVSQWSGVDTLYLADGASAAAGGLRKYSLVGGTWVANGGIVGAPLGQFRGLTGAVNGSAVTLYGTNASSLYSLVDSSGHNSAFNGTANLLASAPANTLFKGVDFAPETAVTGIPGDFNGDQMVDEDDLAQWRDDFEVNDESSADADDDSDGDDFLVWQRNLDVPAASPVPEPCAAALLGIACAWALNRRRDQR